MVHGVAVELGALGEHLRVHDLELDDDGIGGVVSGEFLPENMAALAQICNATGVAIILSSTWRETAPQRRAVEQQLRNHGVGVTEPIISDCTPRLPLLDGGRVAEIHQWVEANRPPSWVAIDDADLTKLPPAHFLQTEAGLGFTMEDAARVVALLRVADAPGDGAK